MILSLCQVIVFILFNLHLIICSSFGFTNDSLVIRQSRDIKFAKQLDVNRDNQLPRINCNNLITKITGWINSPNFPLNYDNSAICSYEIIKCAPDVCQMELLFTSFDVEHSPQCTADYLDLNNGIGRICGILPSNTKKTLTFPLGKDKIRFIFHSDGYNNRKGFQAQVRQLRNSCFKAIPLNPGGSLGSTYIPSKGYNTSYSGFKGYQPVVSGYEPVSSTYESNPYAPSKPYSPSKSYVSSKSYGSVGPSYDPSYSSSYGQSDRPSQSPVQLPVYLGSFCDVYIGEEFGDLRSPNYPNGYPSNVRCTYTIHRRSIDICEVEVVVHRLNLASINTLRCDENSDHLKLPDGTILCGNNYPTKKIFTFSQSTDFMIMDFVSRDNNYGKNAKGFWIDIRQLRNSCRLRGPKIQKCDTLLTDIHVHAKSPNHPSFYGPNQQCVYLIKPYDQNTCIFEMNFLKFRVEPSLVDNAIGKYCFKDFVQLPDGERICGVYKGKRKFYFPKERDRVSMFYFKSDNSIEESGFEVEINQIPHSCNHQHNNLNPIQYPDFNHPYKPVGVSPPVKVPPAITSPSINSQANCDRQTASKTAVIQSSNYPIAYLPFTRCIYTIYKSSSSVCQINVHIEHFDIEPSVGCTNDYLLIESTGERLCGSLTPETNRLVHFPKYNDQLRLIFISDGQIQRSGFEIRIDQNEGSCYPNYPSSRPSGSSRPTGSPTGQSRPNNQFGPDSQQFVEVPNALPSPSRLRPPYDPSFSSFKQICGSTSSMASILTSDNYPLAYNSDTNCVYRIQKTNNKVCKIEFFFEDFEVGTDSSLSRSCQDDYLEIDGRKYCGRRKGERVTVLVPKESDEITLRFFTDDRDRFGGFRIQMRQFDDHSICPSRENAISNSNDFIMGSTESCQKAIYDQKQLQIISPGYHLGYYKPFLHCDYVIQKYNYNICLLEVKFNTFALEESKLCHKDYIQIGDDGVRLCGKLPYGSIKTYEFRGDKMHIRFHSDGEGSGPGFVIAYKQIQC